MDGLNLLIQADAAGLSIVLDGDDLKITGPIAAVAIVNQIAEHKADVVETLRLTATKCDRCGSHHYVDVPIHDGKSTRRDCGTCRRFRSFPMWYGAQEATTT